MITSNGLHFDRSHSGTPDIDPDRHRLVIHGLVKRPLVFSVEALARYPMHSRISFLECAGNSGALYARAAAPLDAGDPWARLLRGMDRRAARRTA
jgi:sulfane dehydrogenase subunit SoxC